MMKKGFPSMYRKLLFSVLVIAALALMNVRAQAGGSTTHRVRAELTGNTAASGQADYRERMRKGVLEQRFSIEVEDAVPGDILAVAVNGTVVGMIVINDLGIGELEYRTPQFIDDPGDGDPIPDGFPHLVQGDVCTVGPLSGMFENH